LTLRAVFIAALLCVVSVFWMHQASLVQVPGSVIWLPEYLLSVPPVPVLFSLIFLVALAPLTRNLVGKHLSKRELIFTYMVLVIGIPPVTYGITEMIIPWMTVPVYFASPQNNFSVLAEELPRWFYPHDAEVIRAMYEGSNDGRVPWGPWLYPLLMWTVFMTLLFFTGLCLVTLFRKQWVDNERLRFPLLLIPLSVVEKEAPGSHTPFFRNPLVWLALAIVASHHVLNIAHSYNPAVTALTDRSHVGRVFTEQPWRPYRSLSFFHRPQLIGLGYFVPLDILFSGWFFFILQPTAQVIAHIFGLTAAPGFPFRLSQAPGAYMALVLVVCWTGRHEIGRIARKALGHDDSIADSDEPMSHRVAFTGAIGGLIALVLWGQVIHLSPVYTMATFGLVLGYGLVYARIRAETGIPTMWGYPFDAGISPLEHAVGTRALIRATDYSDLALTSAFGSFIRGYFCSQMGYQIENERLAEEVKIHPRIMPAAMLVTFVFGCILAYYFNLTAYYRYGATVLHGGTTSGGCNILCALQQWNSASMAISAPTGPDTHRIIAMLFGAIFTVGLVALRWWWLRAPFHPIGYAICLDYGYCLWGPFLVTWGIKSAVHRLGGARLYRQLMPFFLGLAFGDLLVGGITWLAMAVFGPDITAGYMVQFG